MKSAGLFKFGDDYRVNCFADLPIHNALSAQAFSTAHWRFCFELHISPDPFHNRILVVISPNSNVGPQLLSIPGGYSLPGGYQQPEAGPEAQPRALPQAQPEARCPHL